MDPLQTVLRPIAALINRQIQSQTPARALCEGLDGKVCAIRVRDTALSAYLIVRAGTVSLSGTYGEDPDVVISGSLLSLLQLLRTGSEKLIRDGNIELNGDTHIAEQIQRLLKLGRPDPEEELSRVIGDVAAHGLGELVRGVRKWSRNAEKTLQSNLTEYLQEENEILPRRYEVDRFRDRVETLRDDVARCDAKLRLLEVQIADGDTR